MEYLAIIGILVALAGVTYFFIHRRNKKKPAWQSDPVNRALDLLQGRAESTKATTPAGCLVFCEKAVPVPPLAPIDAGIEHTLRNAEGEGYIVDRATYHWKAIVFESELSPESKSPSFRVPIWSNNPYWNTEWDMMKGANKEPIHYVLAAGQYLAAGVPYGDVFIIPNTTDQVYLERVCSYEAEHVVLAHVDGPRFEDTQYHNSIPHPLLAEAAPKLSGFVGKAAHIAECGAIGGKATILVR